MCSSISKISILCLIFSVVLLNKSAQAQVTWERFSRIGKVEDTTPYFSEERGGYSGRQTFPIYGITCSGQYCDNKRLTTVRDGNTHPVQGSGYWTHWFSEENPHSANCPSDMVVNEVQCKGKYCDNIRLQCGRLISGYRVVSHDKRETPWFSEENGKRECPDGYYLHGLACGKKYCDNILMKCVKIEYQRTTNPYKPLTRNGNTAESSRWFSEENEYSGRMRGPVAGIWCSGKYCDRKQLKSVRRGADIMLHTGYWTNWFSEEYPNSAKCPRDMVINEIQCRSKYCDNMRLQCGRVRTGFRINSSDVKVVRYYSEEQGLRYCPNGYYVAGISCTGKYCDSIQLTCVSIDYSE